MRLASAHAALAAATSRARSCVSQVKPSPIVRHSTWVAETLHGHALAGRPGALDELHHADAKTPPERTQRKPEGRRRLALAGTGVDDKQTFFENRLRGDLGVLDGLAIGHFCFVPVRVVGHLGTRVKNGMTVHF